MRIMAYDSLCSQLTISRETHQRFEQFVALLTKWQSHINLVASLDKLWDRHIADSLQLIPFIPRETQLLDMGSGAGLPGMMIAIARSDVKVTLIESDSRKCAFLKEAARITHTEVRIENARIETHRPQRPYDIITSRALAEVESLLSLAYPLAQMDASYLFPKGKKWAIEIDAARTRWDFHVKHHISITDPDAAILHLTQVRRKP